jgi:hypothetical protein
MVYLSLKIACPFEEKNHHVVRAEHMLSLQDGEGNFSSPLHSMLLYTAQVVSLVSKEINVEFIWMDKGIETNL